MGCAIGTWTTDEISVLQANRLFANVQNQPARSRLEGMSYKQMAFMRTGRCRSPLP
jgi:hypothetical protein